MFGHHHRVITNLLNDVRRRYFNAKETIVKRNYTFSRQSQEGRSRLPHGVFGSLVKPTLFAIGVGGGVIVAAEVYAQTKKESPWMERKSVTKPVSVAYESPFYDIVKFWNNIDQARATALTLGALNVGVFLLWRIRAVDSFLRAKFTYSIAHKPAYPMLLSCFSHSSGMHLLFNMYALYSFTPAIHDRIGHERFLALYIASGIFGGFASHIWKLVWRRQQFSLGASGCVVGVAASSCYLNPDSRLSLIFFPFVTFSAGNALVVWGALESLGLFFKGSPLDHAAHLGGMATGLLYTKYLESTGQVRRRRRVFQ